MTGPEIRLTRNPSRNTQATRAITPTSKAVRATSPAYSSGLAMASPPRNEATMIASEELGPIEAWRELEKTKYARGAMIPA